jgi:hypothetical protein
VEFKLRCVVPVEFSLQRHRTMVSWIHGSW